MQLLILTPEYDGYGGGIMTFYRQLVPAFIKAGVNVTLIEGSAQNHCNDPPIISSHGFTHQRLDTSRVQGWFRKLGKFASMPAFRRHLAASFAMWDQAGHGQSFDLVETCDWGLLFIPPLLQRGTPTVVQCHGSIGQIAEYDPYAGEGAQSLLIQFLEKELIRTAESVQTCSPANASYWAERCGRDVEMIPPAWETLKSTSEQELSERALVVGRMQRWKGPETLCAALAQLGERAPPVDWVGRDMPWRSREKSTAEHLRTTYKSVWRAELMRLCAPLPASEISVRQASAYFNIVPSLWDVFNFTIPEAMNSGRPTLVSSGAGGSALIDDGVNGFRFEAGDVGGLANGIERILSHSPTAMAQIGEAARGTIRRELDPDTIAAKRLVSYRDAMSRGAVARSATVDWIDQALRSESDDTSGAFLEAHPLRELVEHIFVRSKRKMSKILGSRHQ